ncbi:hypothetical protein EV191_1011287 [Tamaricihabitans halophyticus]|uniref:Peptidase inhibitor family I36 n=1 Tax=Tamaricihabitans halophyticus TaxID=1262583 RepID=A0A4R2R438_9PSEU|nr:hypothetical protein [Tamaricihabitans halophyticus]TCP57333.1 hypothetical protein EV191_1011287 [Tamaricihabitans halophyticus]
MRGKTRKVGTAAVLAAGLMLAFAPAAAADGPTHKCHYHPSEDVRGWGCFQPHGDHIFVEDTAWEGYGVQVYWETNYGRSDVCRDVNGTSDGIKDCNYNMKEGKKLKFKVQLTNNGSVWTESGWSPWYTI